MANENTVNWLWIAGFYYDEVAEKPLPVRGVDGAMQVILAGADPAIPGSAQVANIVNGGVQVTPAGASGLAKRVSITFQGVAPDTADTLLSLVKSIDGVAVAGATSIGVTATKTLMLETLTLSLKANAAAAAFCTATLRQNPAGATVIGSPSEARVDLGLTAATVGDSRQIVMPLNMKFSGAQTFGVSLAAQAVTNIISLTLTGYEF